MWNNKFIGLITIMMLLLQGCGSEQFVKEQAEAAISEGRPILEEYVNSLPGDARITNVSMVYGGRQGEPSFHAKLPGRIVQATFAAGDEHYTAIVNLEDGGLYSDYDPQDPNAMIEEQLTKYCEAHGFRGKYQVSGAFYSYAFVSHQVEVNKGDIRDVYVYVDNIPNLAPVKSAGEFVNASISGFDIAYEAEYDEVFEPEILYDYLTDTGNYRKEKIRGDVGEYHIKGGRRQQNYVSGETAYYEMNIIGEGAPDTLMCEEFRWDCREEDGFCYLYVGGVKTGIIRNLKQEAYVEYSCPFAFEGTELTYIRDDHNPYEGYLYLIDPKWNEVEMTRYRLINQSADEKTNDVLDRWELEVIGRDILEAVKRDSDDLYELYIKETGNKCAFTEDKIVVSFK